MQEETVVISGLVGGFLRTLRNTKYYTPTALKGFIKGTERPAEQSEPGNPYSRSLRRAIALLDQGVPMDRLVEELKKEGL